MIRSWPTLAFALMFGWLGTAGVWGAEVHGDGDPVLRLEGGGPVSALTAVAFSRDGSTLYETGWDKVIRVWKRDEAARQFIPHASVRVPIGPGDAGVMNALAVSDDENWLAVGGNAVHPDLAGFRQQGLVLPRSSVGESGAAGIVYLFQKDGRQFSRCRQIRAHHGPVEALTFVSDPGGPPLLLTAGLETAPEGKGAPPLVLRLWDVATRQERSAVVAGPYQRFRPSLTAWRGPNAPGGVAAAAWSGPSFQFWDLTAKAPVSASDPLLGRALVLCAGDQPREVLVGHFLEPGTQPRQPEGSVAVWDASAKTVTRRQVLSWTGKDPAPPNVKAVPVALSLVSSRPGGQRDLLAVVMRALTAPPTPPEKTAFSLQLLDLDPKKFGVVRARVELWTGP